MLKIKSDYYPLGIFLLAITNAISAILHLLFTAVLIKNVSIYREFLLVENTLVTSFFAFSAYKLFTCKQQLQKVILQLQIFLWLIFTVCIGLNYGSMTSTLSIFSDYLYFSESSILILSGFLSFVLAIICWLRPRPIVVK